MNDLRFAAALTKAHWASTSASVMPLSWAVVVNATAAGTLLSGTLA